MMHLTLDTLLINDPSSGTDMTGQWESECEERNSPKIKFPLKLIDDSMGELNLDFPDPITEDPKTPKKKKNQQEISIVELKGKNKKNKKKNLF